MAPPPPKLEEALRQKLAEALGDDAASHVHSFRRCGRCGKACDATKCMVEHPAHLRRDRGATVSFSSYESLYACGVCGAEFKEVVDAKNGVISSSKFVGDLVCFCEAGPLWERRFVSMPVRQPLWCRMCHHPRGAMRSTIPVVRLRCVQDCGFAWVVE